LTVCPVCKNEQEKIFLCKVNLVFGTVYNLVECANCGVIYFNPLSLLKECKRIIKPDGYFFLSVPNGYNDSRNLKDFYKSENTPAHSKNEHIFFFPRTTLLMLFDNIGFLIIRKKTGSIKRGLRNIGVLHKKKNWKQQYFPKEQNVSNKKNR